jgi:CBS-domain-containing membrane protein
MLSEGPASVPTQKRCALMSMDLNANIEQTSKIVEVRRDQAEQAQRTEKQRYERPHERCEPGRWEGRRH